MYCWPVYHRLQREGYFTKGPTVDESAIVTPGGKKTVLELKDLTLLS